MRIYCNREIHVINAYFYIYDTYLKQYLNKIGYSKYETALKHVNKELRHKGYFRE